MNSEKPKVSRLIFLMTNQKQELLCLIYVYFCGCLICTNLATIQMLCLISKLKNGHQNCFKLGESYLIHIAKYDNYTMSLYSSPNLFHRSFSCSLYQYEQANSQSFAIKNYCQNNYCSSHFIFWWVVPRKLLFGY